MSSIRAAKFALASLAVMATSAQAANSAQFAPDNDLWMEDNVNFTSGLDEATFNLVITKAKSVYDVYAKNNNEKLVINNRWTDSTVNANCGRQFKTVTVNMYGGLARREEITADGFALVLCHELGHAYGGLPYIRAASKMSAEGQADYYGNQKCLSEVLPLLPLDPSQIQTTAYTQGKCSELHPTDATAYNLCLRQMAAGQSTANLLAVLMKETQPNYETPDPYVIPTTTTTYPKTVQCRLDTYHNAALNLLRPACWFKK